MLTSVLATYKESDSQHMNNVLQELKNTNLVNVKGIVHGQLFDKLTVSIFVKNENLQTIFDVLISNDIEIFPYNEDYRKRKEETIAKFHKQSKDYQDLLRSHDSRDEESGKNMNYKWGLENRGVTRRLLNPNDKYKKEIDGKLKSLMKQFDSSAEIPDNIESLVKRGNYLAIRNLIKKNPQQNRDLKENLVPSIMNCIKRNLDIGLQKRVYFDAAVSKLKDIINDKEIKTLEGGNIVNLAGNALITLCSQTNPEELIEIINSPSVGHKINVLAAIKLSEMILENDEIGGVDQSLLKIACSKVNVRFVLTAYDVIEDRIATINKGRFTYLIDSINKMKNELT
jgi:hypothetical protein